MMAAKRHDKRVGYRRVSSVDQSTERQLEGIQLDKVFTDKASGKDTNRPQLQAALEYLREGDLLLAHSMDRLARSLDGLRKIVLDLTSRGVHVQFVKENLTFTGEDAPMSTLLLALLGAVAEFERSMIRERQREGIALAKKAGLYQLDGREVPAQQGRGNDAGGSSRFTPASPAHLRMGGPRRAVAPGGLHTFPCQPRSSKDGRTSARHMPTEWTITTAGAAISRDSMKGDCAGHDLHCSPYPCGPSSVACAGDFWCPLDARETCVERVAYTGAALGNCGGGEPVAVSSDSDGRVF